ncbi:MAG: hypothetical protein EBR30_02890 [Cytophagia bacterium]|nr:hypothetical protein [Cytophagia bacterium]
MVFKFLEKPIVIKSILPERYAYVKDLFPIQPSYNFIPTHWKNTPKSHFDWEKMSSQTTVRSCFGILGTFTNGFILPLWSDLAIRIRDNHLSATFSDDMSSISLHANTQFPDFYEDHLFLKIVSPWIFCGNKDFNITLVDPFYTQKNLKPYIIPYAVTSSLNKIMNTHFFIFVKKENNKILIKSGTPMAHILFLTDKKVKIEAEVVSDDEYNKTHSRLNKGIYSSFFNKRARFLENLRKQEKNHG